MTTPSDPDRRAAPGSLVPVNSVRERRTQVIAELSHAFSRDQLDVDELDRRMEAAQRALTVADLDALTVDLAPSETALARRPAVTSLTSLTSLTSGVSIGNVERPAQRTILAMLGGMERTGGWVVPQRLKVHCLMGGASLDFREANLAAGVTEIFIACMMGGVEIIVPPNVAVDLDGGAIMGGFEQSQRGADAITTEPVATLRITGLAIAGGVSVETRRIGESSREARKRIKQEAKQRLLGTPSQGQAALPAAVVVDRKKP